MTQKRNMKKEEIKMHLNEIYVNHNAEEKYEKRAN